MKQVKNRKIYTVSEVNHFAKQTLEQMVFWVEGEISSFEENPAWFNSFFTLSDDSNSLPCFLKPNLLQNVGKPYEGKKVMVYGRLTLFRKNQYKLEAYSIEEAGVGILQKKFEELYKKLKSEGLFDEKNKKPIPTLPKKVCVVTSEGSAGWNDFKSHTIDIFSIIELYTADVRVEGPRAVAQLQDILPKIDKMGFDVIVITRGGGASETLLEVFNDERVTRTIFNMETPKIVAVGHELNVSLAELVADRRASTPTDAANIVTSGYREIQQKLDHYQFRLKTSLDRLFRETAQILDSVYFRLKLAKNTFKDMPYRLQVIRESLKRHEKHLIIDASTRVNELAKQIQKGFLFQIQSQNQKLQSLNRSLALLSWKNTLDRGYSIATDFQGKIIRTIANVVVGSTIGVRLSDGNLKSVVKSKSKI
ncbi:MAG: exodeoxyribonuclease VII large subunit [Patescibacteria group bacterium]